MTNNISRKQAIRMLWERGALYYKLHDVQKIMYDEIMSNDDEITTILASRRLGKSFLLCLIATEVCLRNPNSIVKYVCPKQKMVQTIIKPIMVEMLKDCPPEYKPEFKTNDKMYVFKNGSQIQMAGSDNGHHESIRGGSSELWIVDEAGFCTELGYVVNSILAPTTDTTGGRGIIASTPSISQDHDFITLFVQPAELSEKLFKYKIYDNPMLSKEKIQKIIDRYPGGKENSEFRREYECEIITDETKAVFPEFSSYVQKDCIREWERPPFYDTYVSMDIGFKDLTVVLFGYYDFKHDVTVIEDEYFVNGIEMHSDKLAEKILQKEKALWYDQYSGEAIKPSLRISDNNNPILLNDLQIKYGLTFVPTRKDEKHVALNDVRIKIGQRKIIIHPRCKVLIHHMKNGTWDKSRSKYEKSPAAKVIQEDGTVLNIPAGHYDSIDSILYMMRNIQFYKNPYPPGYGIGRSEDVFISPHYHKDEKYQVFIDMFKTNKKKRN